MKFSKPVAAVTVVSALSIAVYVVKNNWQINSQASANNPEHQLSLISVEPSSSVGMLEQPVSFAHNSSSPAQQNFSVHAFASTSQSTVPLLPEQLPAEDATRDEVIVWVNVELQSRGMSVPENQIAPIYDQMIASGSSPSDNEFYELLLAEAGFAGRILDMESLGYFDSLDMDKYDFPTVLALSRTGDMKAMQNVADAYYYLIADDPNHEYFESDKNFRSLAKDLYFDSAAMGSVRSTSVLSEIALMEQDNLLAYAWYEVAKSLGDTYHVEVFEKSKAYRSLDTSEKQQAFNHAVSIQKRLTDRAIELNHTPPDFRSTPG